MNRMAHEERLRRNEESRNAADHFREPWSAEEIDLLMEFWGCGDPEGEVAEALGRTIEACRQRFYEVRRGVRSWSVKVTTTITHTTTMVEYKASVCDRCHLEMTAAGICGFCDDNRE